MKRRESDLSSPACLNDVVLEVDCDFECNLDDDVVQALHESIYGKGLTRDKLIDRLMMRCQRLGCTASCVIVRGKENESLVVDDINMGPYVSNGRVINPLPGCLSY